MFLSPGSRQGSDGPGHPCRRVPRVPRSPGRNAQPGWVVCIFLPLPSPRRVLEPTDGNSTSPLRTCMAGRRRPLLPWVASSWPRCRGKKSHEQCVCCLVWVNWGDSARQPHHIRRLISWWGWVGLAIDTRTEVDDVQSSLRPQPSSIGRRAVMEWKHQGICRIACTASPHATALQPTFQSRRGDGW